MKYPNSRGYQMYDPKPINIWLMRSGRRLSLLLRDFGKKTMDSLYLQPEELYQTLFERVATTYGDDPAHSQRPYDYLSRNWFMAATPVLGNVGFIISMRVKKRWNQLNLHSSTYLFLATLMRRKILWKVYLVSWPRICF